MSVTQYVFHWESGGGWGGLPFSSFSHVVSRPFSTTTVLWCLPLVLQPWCLKALKTFKKYNKKCSSDGVFLFCLFFAPILGTFVKICSTSRTSGFLDTVVLLTEMLYFLSLDNLSAPTDMTKRPRVTKPFCLPFEFMSRPPFFMLYFCRKFSTQLL